MALALQELRGALLVFVILLAMFTDHASEKCAEVRPQRGGKGQTADSLCVAFQQRAHGGCPLILLGRSICPLISQMLGRDRGCMPFRLRDGKYVGSFRPRYIRVWGRL